MAATADGKRPRRFGTRRRGVTIYPATETFVVRVPDRPLSAYEINMLRADLDRAYNSMPFRPREEYAD